MFICLVSVLGMGWDPGTETVTPSPELHMDTCLLGLRSLLQVVGKDNIYNMATDASLDNRHLGYLKALAHWLLQSKYR